MIVRDTDHFRGRLQRLPPLTQRNAYRARGDRPAGDSNTGAILWLLSLPHPRGIGLGPNGIAPEAGLKERFLKQEGSQDSDYGPAIASAIEQGWVMRISDRIRLTAEGHKVSIGRL